MKKCLLTATFGEEELQILKEHTQVTRGGWVITGKKTPSVEMAEIVGDNEILIVELDNIGREVFENSPHLKLIGCCRGNPVNVDLKAATEFGIPVLYTPARNAIAVAELTIAMMVNVARNVGPSYLNLKAGKWDIDGVIPFTYYKGIELAEKTIGLVGLGAIGRELAERLKPFKMKILIYDPYISDEEIQKYGQRATLEEVLRESNFISLHCTVTEETRGMIGKEQFALMRKDAFLINTSRAVVTDREALIEALQNKKIAGAALDVYHEEPLSPDDPILKLDNAFITPHIGGATFDVERHQSRIILTDILRWLEGKQPVNVANPEVLRR